MSKRTLLLTSLGVLILALLVLTNFGRNLPGSGWEFPFFRDPVFTETIPESRPKRLDRRELARSEGQSMDEILERILLRESEKVPGELPEEGTVQDPVHQLLLASLPDAPLPFPANARPEDEAWLREFVTSMKKSENGKPTKEELRRFHLALSALRISPEQLPPSLRTDAVPDPESEVFPIRLLRHAHDLEGPFALGRFGADGEMEIFDRGGDARHRFGETGLLIPLEGGLHSVAGDSLHPGDFNNDGLTDIYLARRHGRPDSLLLNRGDGTFEDATIELGLLAFRDTISAAWIDCDGDGFLDLLVGSSDQPLELYRQTAAGGFQPVAWDLKLWVPRGVRDIQVADFSGDGHEDFFLGIDGLPDRLYVTRPGPKWDEWRFEDITKLCGLGDHLDASIGFLDFNNDGILDLLVLDRSDGSGASPRLYHHEGDLVFRDVSEEVGLAEVTDAISFGIFDLDNDGYPDLFFGTPALAINRVSRNLEGLGFREVSVTVAGSYLDEPLEFASFDVDKNGAADLFYRNRRGTIRRLEPTGSPHPWLRIRLENHAPGTRLLITVRDPDWVIHPVHRVFGSEKTATVGLGETGTIETLEVFLPNEETPVQTLDKVEPNQEVTITLPKRPRERLHVPFRDQAGLSAPE